MSKEGCLPSCLVVVPEGARELPASSHADVCHRHHHAPHTSCCHAPPPCPPRSFITAFVTLFATVIAITKDLPDIEGDKQFGIETFATRMGVR